MVLACQRALFDIPDEIAYLNCAYMSPLLRSATATGQVALARKAQPWRITAADFFTDVEVARTLFAELIGADADGVALIPSASYGLSLAAANLPAGPGRRIVLLDDQFPSNVYPWRDLAVRTGGSIETVPRPDDFDWTTAVLERIDERTAVVAMPPCHWTDGSLVDLVRVGERARAVGAALVVDATQSLGAAPLNVGAVRPDFLVAAAYKWLLGPYSLGFLYATPERRDGRPLDFTWMAREGSEDFAGLVAYRDTFRPGARRYDVGEHSNFALLPVATTALRQILDWGVAAIAETLGGLTASVEREAERLGLAPVPAARRVAHLIGLRAVGPLPADLPERLAAADVYVSVRGNAIRVSPHLYNTAEDVARLFAVLAAAL
ncbi:MAG TPA: aminotransferase class V-fold PLP-dependent enzyme [Ktedonobacterales bacterium]|jgi:selenocysteine lyase/cysteine desulfurase|nr:aminotransferase class V-fold PLP-dependent enzyme [Ktedonobacterales bacterium]